MGCHIRMEKQGLVCDYLKAIPIKCFVSHRPTDPIFWKSIIKKQKSRTTCKEASTLI